MAPGCPQPWLPTAEIGTPPAHGSCRLGSQEASGFYRKVAPFQPGPPRASPLLTVASTGAPPRWGERPPLLPKCSVLQSWLFHHLQALWLGLFSLSALGDVTACGFRTQTAGGAWVPLTLWIFGGVALGLCCRGEEAKRQGLGCWAQD